MTIETENRQAIQTSRRYALLTGLLLILVIVLTPFWALPHLEKDLTAKTLRALQEASLDTRGITVSFSGRSAEIVGRQDDSEQLHQARRLVQNVWGVAGVSARAVEPLRPESLAAPTPPTATEPAAAQPAPLKASRVADLQPEAPIVAERVSQNTSQPPEQGPAFGAAKASQPAGDTGTTGRTGAQPDTVPAPPATDAVPESIQEPEAKADSEPTSMGRQAMPGITAEFEREQDLAPGTAQAESRREGTKAPEMPTDAPGEASPEPQGADIDASPAADPAREHPSRKPEGGPEAPSVFAVAPGLDEKDLPVSVAPAADGSGSTDAGSTSGTRPRPNTLEPSAPGTITARARAASPSVEELLADWPRLSRVHHLQLEIADERIHVSGEVDSLAELRRIQNQTPSDLPADGLSMSLSLVPRDASQLAEYINRLVIERFRFSGPGTRFAVGAELAMDRIAEVMNSYPNIRLGLIGFADPQTHPFARRSIARHRAAAAYHALLKRGVDSRRILMPDFPAPGNPIGAWYRPTQNHPNGQIQLFSLQGNYPWSTPPSK